MSSASPGGSKDRQGDRVLRWVFVLVQIGILALAIALVRYRGLAFPMRMAGHVSLSLAFSCAFRLALPPDRSHWGTQILAGTLALLLSVGGHVCLIIVSVLLLLKELPPGDLLGEFKEHTTLPNIADRPTIVPVDARNVLENQREGVEPLVDMLSTPDPQLKRAVLDTIAKRRNPKLIPHIVAALQDPRPEVYQFAMAKVIKLQEEFGGEIARALDQVKESPDDVKLRWQLVDVYGRYLASGLVDDSLKAYYREQLQTQYAEILRLSPRETEIRIAMARFAIEQGKLGQARSALEETLDIDSRNLKAHIGLVEVLFLQGAYNEMYEHIRTVAAVFAREDGADPKVMDLIRWWLSPGMELESGAS